jgi:hypothetical protein
MALEAKVIPFETFQAFHNPSVSHLFDATPLARPFAVRLGENGSGEFVSRQSREIE